MIITFQSRLLACMRKNKDNVAIEYGDEAITYQELLDRSNAITLALQERDVRPGATVAIALQNRVQFIAAMLGSMNAGVCFAPLDTRLPEVRISSMMQELQPVFIITTKTDWPGNGLGASVIYMDEETPAPGNIEYPVYNPDDNLYIYFSSGSTGKPKGIIGMSKCLLQFIDWELSAFEMGRDVRVGQLIVPYFDAFLRDVFLPLLSGGTICIPPASADGQTPGNLVQWLNEKRINLVHCVPSVFRLINEAKLSSADLQYLKYVLLSGEKIIPAELKSWYQVFNDRIQLVNLYGATESTMIRSYYLIKPADSATARIPVGMPIHDTEFLLLNEEQKPVRKLVTGEIYIVSDYICKGYLNNAALTAERFVTLPDGRRAFRTGDKGRILPDGNLDLIGRYDRQVKLNGIRIEPEEIEASLLASGFIKNVLVSVRADETGRESLLAFAAGINSSEDIAVAEGKLKAYLETLLPAYMIPSRIICTNEFPLLPNGKIDQMALLSTAQDARPVIAPENETEARLLQIWIELLGNNTVSTTETFQSYGGNSIGIMRLIGRIYNEFKIRIPLNELFNRLTIKKLATLVSSKKAEGLLQIEKAPLKSGYALSASQERLYYEYALDEDNKAYNLPMVWEIKNNYDRDKLTTTLLQLIQRHEILRTSFIMQKEGPVQVVHESVDFNLNEIHAGSRDIDTVIQNFIRPFQLGQAPLFRAAVIITKEERRLLVTDIHHIICDGMSQSLLMADFSALYQGVSLQAPEVQYKDYAEWEHQFRLTDEYVRHRQFWLQAFEKEVPVLALPTQGVAFPQMTTSGGNIYFEIPKTSLNGLLSFLSNREITTFSGLFSLFFLFMHRITGQEDIVIGTMSSGRTQREVEKLPGMFVKTLPVRQQIDAAMLCSDFIEQVHRFMVQAANAQSFDLADIMIALNRNAMKPVSKLFDVGFTLHNYEMGRAADVTDDIIPYSFENSEAKYPVMLYADEKEQVFQFRWEYALASFTRNDSEWLAAEFQTIAVGISESLSLPIMDAVGSKAGSAQLIADDISFNF
jgi:mycobactin peptide synthetase MbtE